MFRNTLLNAPCQERLVFRARQKIHHPFSLPFVSLRIPSPLFPLTIRVFSFKRNIILGGRQFSTVRIDDAFYLLASSNISR